jgi:hypothetical protein
MIDTREALLELVNELKKKEAENLTQIPAMIPVQILGEAFVFMRMPKTMNLEK